MLIVNPDYTATVVASCPKVPLLSYFVFISLFLVLLAVHI